MMSSVRKGAAVKGAKLAPLIGQKYHMTLFSRVHGF